MRCAVAVSWRRDVTFVELIAVEELGPARLVAGPWPIPDELATDAVVAILEVLIRGVNASLGAVWVRATSITRTGPSG